MLGIKGKDCFTCGTALANAMLVSSDRAKKGKADESKKKTYETQLATIEKDINELTTTGNHLLAIYKNIQQYNIVHKERVRNILDLAIEEAGSLVPDADVQGIHLNHSNDNRVTVVNGCGQDVNLREGGGYRAILGALLRYACLKAQPDALQVILFDEYFFTLSDTTTAAMKDIFEAMKKDITIICIEQRRNAMDGIVDAEYTFKKDLMKKTTVTKTI